jgi:hypothetical protein
MESGVTEPGEARVFSFPNTVEPVYVIWWHIWGDELVPSNFHKKSIGVVIKELWVWLAQRKGRAADQIFVRIHGGNPIEELSTNPVVRKFVHLFPQVSN